MNEKLELLRELIKKSDDALRLLSDSVSNIKPFDPTAPYSPKELEPYDAMSSRFERIIELLLGKCFRAYETYLYGVSDGSTRDLLNKMEKRDIIGKSVDKWLDIRDLRNKMAHDYLPEQLGKMYDTIIDFYPEIAKTIQKLKDSI